MSFSRVTMKVNGEEVTVDLEHELGVGDLSADMDKVAAQMAYWGAVWAAAEAERERVDAHYRRWRAQFSQKLIAADPKLAEWKRDQAIDSEDKFIEFKDAAAQALHNSILSKSMFESFKAKSSQLQSKGAMKRAEMEAGGMATKLEEAKTKSPERSADRVSAMKDLNKKKART